MKDKLLTKEFFQNGESIAFDKICRCKYVWQSVAKIKEIVREIIPTLDDNFEKIGEGVYVFRGVYIPKSAEIIGPAIIDEGAEIRHGAYIRGNAIIGRGCVLGNSCEIKDSILFDNATVPHFNYVGNSILGKGAHLGAGAIISNLKGDKSNVKIRYKNEIIDTGLRKFGAVIGNGVEVGCGTVLNPGTIILKGAQIYPLSSVRGVIDENVIYKSHTEIIKRASFN